MTLGFVPELGPRGLTSLHDHGLDAVLPILAHGVSIQSQRLALVHHKLDAPMIELLQGACHVHLHVTLRGSRRSQSTPVRRPEHTPEECLASGIVHCMEGVALEKEAIENLVAILLVHVSPLVRTGAVLDTYSEHVLTVLVIDDLQLR
jgi:hypothetical protein